jgi:hypothetical protein
LEVQSARAGSVKSSHQKIKWGMYFSLKLIASVFVDRYIREVFCIFSPVSMHVATQVRIQIPRHAEVPISESERAYTVSGMEAAESIVFQEVTVSSGIIKPICRQRNSLRGQRSRIEQ